MDQPRSKWQCKKKRVEKSEGKGWRKKMVKKEEKMKETTATERKQRKKRRRRIVNFV